MTHFDVNPDSAVMEALESQAFTVDSVTYTGNTPQAYVVTTAPPGPETFYWRTADTLVAKPSSQAGVPQVLIHAVDSGETTLRVTPAGGIPSGNIVGAKLGILGRVLAIKVLPGEPPIEHFAITDILGPDSAITTVGNRQFQAVVQYPPEGVLRYRWLVTRSDHPTPLVNVETTSATRTVFIPAGSYQLSVTVTPRVGADTAYPRTEHWAVCNNIEALLAPVGDGPGTSSAPEGC